MRSGTWQATESHAEKLRILEEATQTGASVAAVARKHAVNANLLFGWVGCIDRAAGSAATRAAAAAAREDHRIDPHTDASRVAPSMTEATPSSQRRAATPEKFVEIVVADEVRIRLHGEAQHALLKRVLAWLPRA